MLNNVTMKEYAVAEIQIDKKKTESVINSIDNAISVLRKESEELYVEIICELLDLKNMFQLILADFRN